MKLSTKGRYGLKAMFELAKNYGSGTTPLNVIAQRQNISEHYLEQLIAVLRKAGLVKSVRGAQGGYILAKSPETITIGDVLRVLEGPIAPVDCVNEDEPETCTQADFCVTRSIWARVRDSVTEVVDSITLLDMIEEEKARKNENHMYYI